MKSSSIHKVWKPAFRDSRSYKEVMGNKDSTTVEVPMDKELKN